MWSISGQPTDGLWFDVSELHNDAVIVVFWSVNDGTIIFQQPDKSSHLMSTVWFWYIRHYPEFAYGALKTVIVKLIITAKSTAGESLSWRTVTYSSHSKWFSIFIKCHVIIMFQLFVLQLMGFPIYELPQCWYLHIYSQYLIHSLTSANLNVVLDVFHTQIDWIGFSLRLLTHHCSCNETLVMKSLAIRSV